MLSLPRRPSFVRPLALTALVLSLLVACAPSPEAEPEPVAAATAAPPEGTPRLVLFVAIDQFHWIPVALIAFRELAMSLYRSTGGRNGVSVPATYLAKVKTTVQIWALGFALIPPVAEHAHWIATLTLWAAVALTYVTGWQYLVAARQPVIDVTTSDDATASASVEERER